MQACRFFLVDRLHEQACRFFLGGRAPAEKDATNRIKDGGDQAAEEESCRWCHRREVVVRMNLPLQIGTLHPDLSWVDV